MPGGHVVIRQDGDQGEHQDRQDNQQDEKQQGQSGGAVAPGAQVDLMRAKAFAGHCGKTFHLRGKAPIEINEYERDAENAHAVGGGEIMIGGKRAQGFAPDFRREDFNARGQRDNRRRIEAFHGANEIQRAGGENRRANQRKGDPFHDAEFIRTQCLGRFLERRVHAF